MTRFSTASVDEVVPRRKLRQPSVRSQVAREYREALQNALVSNDRALVIELEGDDKPLTIRNRIKRAAAYLGYDNVVVRRRGSRIVVYQPSEDGAAPSAAE